MDSPIFANLVLLHVFRLHGLPVDVVSDHFNVHTAINHHCSQRKKRRFPVRQLKPSSITAAEHGSKLTPPSFVMLVATVMFYCTYLPSGSASMALHPGLTSPDRIQKDGT